MKTNRFTLALSLLAACVAGKASAQSMLATYAEAPGALTTSVDTAEVFTFDDLPTGSSSNVQWTDAASDVLGVFDHLYISSGNSVGGADGTLYSLEGERKLTTTTLTLTNDCSYFGMWWSAGDNSNVLSFYENTTLIARFTCATLLNKLPSTYDGMPSGPYAGQDPSQPYAYINFYGLDGLTFNKIAATGNSNGAGFESDNWALNIAPTTPTGVPIETITGSSEAPTDSLVPEPSSLLLGAVAGIGLALRRRRA